MIVDKLFDSVYDVASRYVTHWRIGCFVLAMLIESNDFYELILGPFWLKSAADFGGALIGVITKAPLWAFVFTLLMAFYVAPLFAKLSVHKILVGELQKVRVSTFMATIDEAVLKVPLAAISEELELALGKAQAAERKILRYKSLLEVLAFWIACWVMMFACDKASIYALPVALLWPLFCWKIVLLVVEEYLCKIYYYKRLAVRVGGVSFIRNDSSCLALFKLVIYRGREATLSPCTVFCVPVAWDKRCC